MNSRQAVASFSLEGCIRTVVEVSTQWWNRAVMRQQNNKIKNTASARRYPDWTLKAREQFELLRITDWTWEVHPKVVESLGRILR